MSLVSHPITFILVAVFVNHLTFAMTLLILPLTDIFAAVIVNYLYVTILTDIFLPIDSYLDARS